MNEKRQAIGQRFFKQTKGEAAPGRLFVPVDTDTLEALGRAAKARGVPVGALAAELLAETLKAIGSGCDSIDGNQELLSTNG